MFRHMLTLIVLVITGTLNATAGLTVSPAAVYLNDDMRRGRIHVMNTDSVRRIVRVTMKFGYPASDAEGNISLQFFEGKQDGQSATGWVSVYPETAGLNPGESQVFVISAEPPGQLATGEYWARPIIYSREAHTPASNNTASDFGVALSINYRHGDVGTGVNIDSVTAQANPKAVAMRINLARRGNAAFLGNMVTRIRNKSGRYLSEEKRDIAVYRTLTRVVSFDIASLAHGKYVAEVEFNTARTGNAPGDIIPAQPVRITLDFTMPDRKLEEPEINNGGAALSRTVPPPRKNPDTMNEQIKVLERALRDIQAKQAEIASALSSLRTR